MLNDVNFVPKIQLISFCREILMMIFFEILPKISMGMEMYEAKIHCLDPSQTHFLDRRNQEKGDNHLKTLSVRKSIIPTYNSYS